MFSRLSTLVVAITAASLAVAVPTPGGAPAGGQCNTGSIQCCNSVQDASSSGVSTLAGLLGIVLGPITGQVGLTCNPISVIGIGGNSCSAQPVCCTGNNFNGLIVAGCTPINLNL
ncbi:Hydrophobin-3 [Stygiomarasmius scandens]|uniref:Hydrophobin n=1 Tax=Marasmiellus scandens TaxID=2682957 RepID=A0ABR1ISH1_9AGAR